MRECWREGECGCEGGSVGVGECGCEGGSVGGCEGMGGCEGTDGM